MNTELPTLIGVAAAPTLTVLLGIFLNAQGLRDLRAESRADRSELSAKIEQLSEKIDKHEAKTQERLDRFFEKITEQDSRINRLEHH